MGYKIGYQGKFKRFLGYGIPAICDHPGCETEIDRGMGHACYEGVPYDSACGGFFCSEHHENYVYPDEIEDLHQEELNQLGLDPDEDYSDIDGAVCCRHSMEKHKEAATWINFILTDESWEKWREKYTEQTANLKKLYDEKGDKKYLIVGPDDMPD